MRSVLSAAFSRVQAGGGTTNCVGAQLLAKLARLAFAQSGAVAGAGLGERQPLRVRGVLRVAVAIWPHWASDEIRHKP